MSQGWMHFTQRARRVVYFAQEQAAGFGEKYVGTEHLLLGLVHEDSVSSKILERLGVSQKAVREAVGRRVSARKSIPSEDMQLSDRSKRVIDLAYDEARQLRNSYLGTEHLLLGLLREGEGIGAQALGELGVDLEKVRREVYEMQGAEPGGSRTFTAQARRAIFFGQEDAGEAGSAEVSPDHLFLGVVREPNNGAAKVLVGLGISIRRLRDEVRRRLPKEAGSVSPDTLLTVSAKRVIDLAYDEARVLDSSNIGTDHLLMGIIREGRSETAKALAGMGVNVERAREEAAKLRSQGCVEE